MTNLHAQPGVVSTDRRTLRNRHGLPSLRSFFDHTKEPAAMRITKKSLVVLAGRRSGQPVDERPSLRNPPARHLVPHELLQLRDADLLTRVQDDRGKRTFLPSVVGHGDDRSLENRRM